MQHLSWFETKILGLQLLLLGKTNDCGIHFWVMNKNKAVDRRKNIDLTMGNYDYENKLTITSETMMYEQIHRKKRETSLKTARWKTVL